MVELQKRKLKNGLTILFEKRDVDVTTVMLGVGFGSIYEKEEEKGIAHFIEHLCFKGTKNRTVREIGAAVEDVGGVLNAFTGEEKTAYHAKIPSNYLELGMDLIFDIFFNPIFPKDEFEKEKNVILEEIKMYKDQPMAHALNKIKENLFEKPFGLSISGSAKSVSGLTREKVLEFHRKIYVPANSVLVVVGNNDFEDVVKFAEKFCVDKDGESVEKVEVGLKNVESVEVRKGLEQAQVVLGFSFPLASEKERFAGEVFSAVLGVGMSSKLFQEVREKRGLVYGVKSEQESGKNYSYFIIWAGTDKSKVEEVKKICLEEFEKMGNLSEGDLKLAKEKVIGQNKVNNEGSEESATDILVEQIVNGNIDAYENFEKNINAVSLDEIKKLASKKKFASFVLSS